MKHVTLLDGMPWPSVTSVPDKVPSDWLELYTAGVNAGDGEEVRYIRHIVLD